MNTYCRPPCSKPCDTFALHARGVLVAAACFWACSTFDAGATGQAPQVGGAERITHDLNLAAAHRAVSTTAAAATTESNPAVPFGVNEEPAIAEPLPLSASQPERASEERLTALEPTFRSDGSVLARVPALADKYANLQPGVCRVQARKRKIPAILDHGLAVGISAPMRIIGPLRGVRFIAPGPKSVHGKLDCRLLLLLDELSVTLAELGVASVHVDGFYRPKAHLPGKKSPSQHAHGLAIDIHALGLKDGRTLIIERDFAGQIGAPVCGPSAVLTSDSRDAIELRNIVCALARAKAFHYLLTPNHDASHRNHLHADIKRGAREHIVR